MNCEEVQELSPLWAGGELDGMTREAFATHLEGCAACAHLLEQQAALDLRLLNALKDDYPDPSRTERAVLRRIAAERRRRVFVFAGIAATAMAVLWIGIGARANRQPERLYADAARDHRVEIMEHQPRRWRSELPDVDAVAKRFGLTAAKTLEFAPEGYKLTGAKTCGLEGRPALHLVYSNGEREFSLYVRSQTGRPQKTAAAQIAGEYLTALGNATYSAVVVTTGGMAECRQIAERTAALL
jgi:anti-sigma factor RsiW